MPKIVSVKEELGYSDPNNEDSGMVMDILPGEVEGQDAEARVLVDFDFDEGGKHVHVHGATDGQGRNILRDLPAKLIKRWEAELIDAASEGAEGEGTETASGSESTESGSETSEAEKDYAEFDLADALPEPLMNCLGSFAQLNSLCKGKAASAGEIRDWGGKKYQKRPDGSWKPVAEDRVAGAKRTAEAGRALQAAGKATQSERTAVHIKRGLGQWVKDARQAEASGNHKLFGQLKAAIDQEIKRYNLHAQTVWDVQPTHYEVASPKGGKVKMTPSEFGRAEEMQEGKRSRKNLVPFKPTPEQLRQGMEEAQEHGWRPGLYRGKRRK